MIFINIKNGIKVDSSSVEKSDFLIELFEQQALKTPDLIAVEHNNITLTYAELNRKSDKVAYWLISQGIGAEKIVAIALPPSIERLIYLVGIMKCGAAYLPVDIDYPLQRIKYILEDAQASCLVGNSAFLERMKNCIQSCVVLCNEDDVISKIANEDNPTNENTTCPLKREQLCYVIYTSGSTGNPKGVMISQYSLLNFILSMKNLLRPNEQDVFFSLTSISFDIAALEHFLPLVSGSKICIIDNDIKFDGNKLKNTIIEKKPTILQGTPASWQLLREADWKPSSSIVILCGGDTLNADLKDYLCSAGIILNLYGPTETTVWSLTALLQRDDVITIGEPIWDTEIYVLDEKLQKVNSGNEGELYISGGGLARGYLGRADLTATRFVACPFLEDGARMYRTGDIVKWNEHGQLIFCGRSDNQIKIHGYRIEIGEIESVLLKHLEIDQSVVVIKKNDLGHSSIVAYVTATNEMLTIKEIKIFLSERLPSYMCPQTIYILDKFPLTPNQKIDRNALVQLSFNKQNVIIPYRTNKDRVLVEIFNELFGMNEISLNDNFFELGGDSLLATRLANRIHRRLNANIFISEIFNNPCIKDLSDIINEGVSEDIILNPTSKCEKYELSFAQQRLWFIYKLENSKTSTYNMPIRIDLTGELNIAALESALNGLVKRHKILRTTYIEEDGHPFQRIMHKEDYKLLKIVQISDNLKEVISEESGYLFDLENELPIRAILCQINKKESVLLLCIHHIACDGWSEKPLIDDLSDLYNNFGDKDYSLSELPIQYIDYAAWQREFLGKDENKDSLMRKQLEFWKKVLNNRSEILNIVTDYPRPVNISYAGDVVFFKVPQKTYRSLIIAGKSLKISLFMLLQGIVSVLFAKMGAGSDIILGTPVAGRRNETLNDLIGFFVNTLVLRVNTSMERTFEEILTSIREYNLQAYNNQDIPFDYYVDKLQSKRSTGYHPIFQVMLVLQNNEQMHPDFDGMQSIAYEVFTKTSKFDLTFEFTEVLDEAGKTIGLEGNIEYAMDLFKRSSIEIMIKRLLRLFDLLLEKIEIPIGQLNILNKEEKECMTVAWNNTFKLMGNECVPELFERQVKEFPKDIALICKTEQLSYLELNERANKIAHWLIENNIGTEQIIGMAIPRSEYVVISMLGILKAGAVYLPLDPEYPKERLKTMITDAEVSGLITTSEVLGVLKECGSILPELTLLLDDYCAQEQLARLPVSNPTNNSRIRPLYAQNSCYMIYTSGSSGTPKGTIVTHGGIQNLTLSYSYYFKLTHGSRFLQFSSISFDATFCELCCTLLVGATLMLTTAQELLPIDSQSSVIEFYQPTHITFSPTSLELIDYQVLENCENIMVAGEICPLSLMKRWSSHKNMINAYGPTETTVDALYWKCDGEYNNDYIPVGKPIFNTQIYILDEYLNPVPVGVIGDLYISGKGLARGYYKNSALTANSYVACPYGLPGERMYRTGDVAYWLADGLVVVTGRADNQIKLRGFRIELGEIEANLMRHKLVSGARVICRNDVLGQKQLVGYVVLNKEQKSDLSYDNLSAVTQLTNWRDLHESDYREQKKLAFPHDFSGWTSSYDDKPIAITEMTDWLKEAAERILNLNPHNVLEIGVGSGLILWEVAPKCESYWGIDFAQSAINALERNVKGNKEIKDKVHLRCQDAHNMEGIPENFFDTIIINSVIQYFPNIQYMYTVLEQSLHLLKSGGRIFIGDIRNFKLQRCFQTSIAIYKRLNNMESADDLKKIIEHNINYENELLFSPKFFAKLSNKIESVSGIAIEMKNMKCKNELSDYRYDVVVYKNADYMKSLWNSSSILWTPEFSLSDLLLYMDEKHLEAFRIKEILNVRLSGIVKITEEIWNDNEQYLRGIDYIIDQLDKQGGIDPYEFSQEVRAQNFDVKIVMSETGNGELFDAIILRKTAGSNYNLIDTYVYNEDRIPCDYANTPSDMAQKNNISSELRDYLSGILPDYMVPASIVVIDKFPLTLNGKLNIELLPEPIFRTGTIQLPINDTEKAIADLFSKILGISPISREDRFFDLGGDSIRSIQLSALARNIGLDITVKDIYTYQSVNKLAAHGKCIEAPVENSSDQFVKYIPSGVNRIIKYYPKTFEISSIKLFTVPSNLCFNDVSNNIKKLLSDNIFLQFRLDEKQKNLKMFISGLHVNFNDVFKIHFLESSGERRQCEIAQIAESLKGEIDYRNEQLLRMAWIETKESNRYLLVILSDILADITSWNLLYKHLFEKPEGNELKGGNITNNYNNFMRQLGTHDNEKEYWLKAIKSKDIVETNSKQPMTNRKISVVIENKVTLMIAELITDVLKTEEKLIYLTVFLLSLLEWRKNSGNAFRIQIENYCRLGFNGIYPPPIIGNFSTDFPLRFSLGKRDVEDMNYASFIGESILRIKEALQSIPDKGIGYEILRNSDSDLDSEWDKYGTPSVSYGFTEEDDFIDYSNEESEKQYPYNLKCDLRVNVSKGAERWNSYELVLNWNDKEFSEKQIIDLIAICKEKLYFVMNNCCDKSLGGYTPSDFPLVKLSKSNIQQIQRQYLQIEDIWPATPLQHGLLMYDAFNLSKDNAYLGQNIFDINGNLDSERLKRSFEILLQRHPNFRAAFISSELDIPVQVILPKIDLPWSVHNFSSYDAVEQDRKFLECMEEDSLNNFDLMKPPFIRVRLFCLSKDSYRLVITDHHIIIDGWSVPILMEEIFDIYHCIKDSSPLPEVIPYKYYVEWLSRQNKQKAMDFWEKYLKDAKLVKISKQKIQEDSIPKMLDYEVSKQQMQEIICTAKQVGVTLNIFFECAWGLFLSELLKLKDVVFGITVAERPPEIQNANSIVGLMINTVPCRIPICKTSSVEELLLLTQETQYMIFENSHLGLVEIQKCHGAGELFDTYYVFQNYPEAVLSFNKSLENLSIIQKNENGNGVSHYPLGITVLPGQYTKLIMGYSSSIFNENHINSMLNTFVDILERMARNPKMSLDELVIIESET